MSITRRELIKALAFYMATLPLSRRALGSSFPSAGQNVGSRLICGSGHDLGIIDTSDWKLTRRIPLSFNPHSYISMPFDLSRGWVVQRFNFDSFMREQPGRYTSMAALVDISKGEIIKKISAPANSTFRGHGVFIDGTIFLTRVDENSGNGYLSGYDAKDGKQVADYKVSEVGAHDVVLTNEGHALMLSSGIKYASTYENTKSSKVRGAKGLIVKVDLKKGKILSEIVLENENQDLSHLKITKKKDIIASTTSETVPLIYMVNSGGNTLEPLQYNDYVSIKNTGKLFEVLLDDELDIALVSNPSSDRVIFVDTQKRTLISELPFNSPWGLALDAKNNNYIVTSSNSVGIIDRTHRTIKTHILSSQSDYYFRHIRTHCTVV